MWTVCSFGKQTVSCDPSWRYFHDRLRPHALLLLLLLLLEGDVVV